MNPAFLFNQAFIKVDKELAGKKGLHSGCTAAVTYIRTETRDGTLRRVLYTANVGDARVILDRGGVASRLSYDHKGSDLIESRRIVETGGFMMNHRVNGISRSADYI
jgi:protein phosphatase PTC1